MISRADMAARGVPPSTASTWYKDRARTGHPEKAGRIGRTDYWHEDEWTAWHQAYQRGKIESLTRVDRDGDPDDLVNAAEAARMLRYASRDVIHANRRLGYFPEPDAHGPSTQGRPAPLWKRSTVWAAADRRPGLGGGRRPGTQAKPHPYAGDEGLSAKTINDYKSLAESNLIPFIGAYKLKELTADNVDDWLEDRRDHLTTRTLQAIHSILRRAIRRAQARDKVVRNVAALVDTPDGRKDGRPSKAMNLAQATTVLEHAKDDPLYAYIVLSLMTGVRTEEARALRWSHVVAWVPEAKEWRPVTEVCFKHKKYAVYVWRSVREDGDTKTEKSRRTLEIPDDVARALKEHHAEQAKQRLKAGKAWQDNDMVFATTVGTPLDAANVRRSFRRITKAAGLGECWTPRELRHSFVSIMSDNGVTIKQIADLVGHKTTVVTQKVYRHQLKPVISTGATAMNTIFGNKKSA